MAAEPTGTKIWPSLRTCDDLCRFWIGALEQANVDIQLALRSDGRAGRRLLWQSLARRASRGRIRVDPHNRRHAVVALAQMMPMRWVKSEIPQPHTHVVQHVRGHSDRN